MSEQNQNKAISRRTFIRGTAMGTGAAGVAAATLGAPSPVQAKTEGSTGRKEAGYRETEHVRRVYALSRF